MLSVPATAPLRLPDDIEKCIDEFAKGDVDMVITVTDAHRNPWFNMVRENLDRTVDLVIKPEIKFLRRQDAPIVYDMTTVAYVVCPKYVLEQMGHFSGRVRAVKIPFERSIDIDTKLDFEWAKFCLSQRDDS